jgi:hypothetical protein
VRVAEGVEGDEVDLADHPRVEDTPHRADDGGVLVVVTRKEDSLDPYGMLEHRARVLGRRGERLLANDVEPAIEGQVGEARVLRRRDADVDEVEAGRGVQHRLRVLVDLGAGDELRCLGAASRVRVGDGHDIERARLIAIRGQVPVLRDETAADDRAPQPRLGLVWHQAADSDS